MSIDDNHDDALARYEEELDRGEAWRYPTSVGDEMPAGMPNPLVIRVTGVSTGTIKGESLQFLNGVDAKGKRWSRIIGSKTLRETLLDGIISEWSDEQQAYVETGRVGEVRPGERVALRFRGFSTIKSGPNKGKEIPSLKVDRPDATAGVSPKADEKTGADDDSIPF